MPRTRVAQRYAIRLVIMVLRLTFRFVRYRQRSTFIFLQDPMSRKSVNVSRSSLNAVQTGQLNGALQSILHVLAADLLRQIPSISASNLVGALETCTERHSSRMSVNAHPSSPNVVEIGRLNSALSLSPHELATDRSHQTSPTSQEVGNLKPSRPVQMRSLDQCYAHSPLNDCRVAAQYTEDQGKVCLWPPRAARCVHLIASLPHGLTLA